MEVIKVVSETILLFQEQEPVQGLVPAQEPTKQIFQV